ncbi:MAG: PLP-dependent aspartate aminotransferase family protein [Rothia sp. (in: high G+C Gram-positive bacteria)]|nr:PLP-dependent aspartate aminotransferase family protein [Rothia sp. (in: high G+C Gram-positive bacteria)]
MTESHKLHAETLVVSQGRPAHEHDAPVNTPIYMTSTFRGAKTVDTLNDKVYARFHNPSWDDLEEVIASLEEAELPGLTFASGMAAVAAVEDLVPVGSAILIPRHTYMASISLAQKLERRGVCEVIRYDLDDTEGTLAAMEAAASARSLSGENIDYRAPKVLMWIESPTNPMLEIADLTVLLPAAQKLGIVTAVDNTFSTPLVQKPLNLGADIVVHSATKFIAGHSDVVMGLAVTNNPVLRAAMLEHRTVNGAIAGPFEAFLALRGVRTLALRVQRSMANAQELAERLQEHPMVREVRYPGLPADPFHKRAVAQMDGFGAVLCVVLDADAAGTDAMVNQLQLWTPATSLGGVESLIERRRRHLAEPDSIPESLLRLSVGIENVEDLYRDLDQAMRSVPKASKDSIG